MAAALAAICRGVSGRLLACSSGHTAALESAFSLLHHSEPVVATQVGAFIPAWPSQWSPTRSRDHARRHRRGGRARARVLRPHREFARSRYFAPGSAPAGGANGALLTGDLFNLFVFVEVMLLPSYALIAMTGGWRRLGVGRLFVVVNLLTSTVLLAGVGFVYASAGAVNIAALAGAASEDGRVAAALGIVVMALCIKAGAVPVHGWLPRAYPGTSAGVMALFSALHTKVALYAVIRIWATAFDLDRVGTRHPGGRPRHDPVGRHRLGRAVRCPRDPRLADGLGRGRDPRRAGGGVRAWRGDRLHGSPHGHHRRADPAGRSGRTRLPKRPTRHAHRSVAP